MHHGHLLGNFKIDMVRERRQILPLPQDVYHRKDSYLWTQILHHLQPWLEIWKHFWQKQATFLSSPSFCIKCNYIPSTYSCELLRCCKAAIEGPEGSTTQYKPAVPKTRGKIAAQSTWINAQKEGKVPLSSDHNCNWLEYSTSLMTFTWIFNENCSYIH